MSVYLRPVTLARAAKAWRHHGVRLAAASVCAFACLIVGSSCTTIDPGPNFVIPDETFNANYFFCHVEPEVIFAKKCGDAQQGSCHFNSSAVSGMALQDHPPIMCDPDTPVDMSTVAPGSPAQSNFTSASLDMSRDYLTAPMYVRPLCSDSSCAMGHSHPLGLFTETDPVVNVLKTWAQKP